MGRQTAKVSILIGLALVLVLAFPLLALAEITKVQMGVDGMI